MHNKLQYLVTKQEGREILKRCFGPLALDIRSMKDFHKMVLQLMDVDVEKQKQEETQTVIPSSMQKVVNNTNKETVEKWELVQEENRAKHRQDILNSFDQEIAG